ncbi:MAG: efflux RND transporter periplasmic adaptor subunit [Halocynthiibacter sp.]
MLIKQTATLALSAFLFAGHPGFAQEALKPVKIITASDQGPEMTRQFFGQVVARQTVDLAFQVPGQVINFPVIEGATLREGDLVAQLDLESFELKLKQAKLQKDQADRTLKRLQTLSKSSASQVRIDDAATQAALADVAVENAAFALKHATLTAPFEALVATRNIANFTTIGAGAPIVRLHDMSEIRIEVDVPEVLFLRAESAPNVEINAKFPSSDQLFPLSLREFNAETSKVGQSYRVTLGMTPPKGLRILPGASATVIVTFKDEFKGVIVVPKTSVFTDERGTPNVFIFTPSNETDGTLSKAVVEITPAPNGMVAITSGVPTGSEIVAAGGAALKDGEPVRRFNGFGN